MKDFVAYLIKNLVDQPDVVVVDVVDDTQGMIVKVKVSQDDIAKVVGRQGRTIRSLRTITGTIGAKFGRKVRLDVVQ